MHKILVPLLLFSTLGFAQNLQIMGKVQDYHKQEPIVGANVLIKKLVKKMVNGEYANERIDYKATSTDAKGDYLFSVPTGEYVIEASFLGYLRSSKFINAKENAIVNIELSEAVNQLDDVEVKAQKAEDNIRGIENTVKLNIKEIKKLPIVFGEGDIIKALTLQPGVTTTGEGAGGFNVRGGKTDQNLVLLDDAPLFNTSHLLGFFTSINAEAVQNATLYKAGVPARYGGRLSSLLNINTKTNAAEQRKSVGVGPISTNLLFQQPFQNNKGSLVLAGRLAYPNLMLGAFPKRFKGSKASFYDFNGTAQYRIGKSNSLKLMAYQSADAFKFPEDTSYFWRSTAATVQWSSFVNERFSWDLKGILSHYTFGVNGLKSGYEYELNSSIRHHEVRADALYQLKNHKFEAGGGMIFYRLLTGSIEPTSKESVVQAKNLPDDLGIESSAYLSYDWTISKRIALQAGLRYAQFQHQTEQVYVYQPNLPRSPESMIDTLQFGKNQAESTFGGLEPRFSLKVELSDKQSIKANYNRTRQFLHLISNTTAISPIDYWKLSSRYIEPQVADQYALGFYQNLKGNSILCYVEGFYKNMNQLVEYKDGASLLLNPHLETEVLPAIGKAYGVEASIQKNQGRLTGNIAYTWSRSWVSAMSEYTGERINRGVFYPSLFDKPHNLSLLGQYFIGKGWTFSSTFTYQTGRPVTYPDGQYVYNNSLIFNYSARNADRLPDYHRFDVSFSRDNRRTKTQKKYHTLNISFYNLYARKNPYSIFFKQWLTVSKAYQLSVLGAIVPSVTINKYF